MTSIRVNDAYVRESADGSRWKIGTRAVEWTYEFKDGSLTLPGFRNKTVSPPREYIAQAAATTPFTVKYGEGTPWVFRHAAARRARAGGMPVAQFTMELQRGTLTVRLHAIAYPGTSVLRQWLELENTGAGAMTAEAAPWTVPVQADPSAPFSHYWMVGGNSQADQGQMHRAPVASGYERELAARSTHAFMPWTALQRGRAPDDGWFMALEYVGNWSLSAHRAESGPIVLSAAVPDLAAVSLAPGQKIELPVVTIGVFAGTLDDLMVRAYDWQYRYLWDYTNMDYYARPKWAVPWTYCAQNLQEQFAERLAFLDMDADLARHLGFEMLWDDAGWAAHDSLPPDHYASVFVHQYEGPDFRLTRRYLDKMGMNWLAWFCGRPAPGVIAGKVGAWGEFEWRTDGVDLPDWAADRDLRGKIVRFLDGFPRASFHTCSGGSAYSHTFEIQRYANTNYFSDFGRGPQTNYYFSYVEPPDKWVDIIEPWGSKGAYRPETARQLMTMVPFWGLKAAPGDQECLRQDLDLFRFLRREGVVGRWSYLFHPAVKGDDPIYYAQRTCYDRTKACVVLKHRAIGPVNLFPRGLLPGHRYAVEFAVSPERSIRTGADLMANGIALADQAPGELIFLGLPHRPGSGRDTAAPTPPANVIARRESNIGHAGVGVYWSAGKDDHWISYYEVKRGERVLGKVSIGTYFFDHTECWDPAAAYAVRTVNGDGKASEWTPATGREGETDAFCALGGLFPLRGRDGWGADTTVDGVTFTPMVWVKPLGTSSADEGGTPNQPGGIEGWWEGQGGARLGRAWMQSSAEACSVRTWVAPKSGSVRIVSRVMKEWYSQASGHPFRVRILQGDKQVWPENGWAVVPLRDLVGVTHNIRLQVAAGDAIRFVLDRAVGDRKQADIRLGEKWTVFAACVREDPIASAAEIRRIPATLMVGGKLLTRHEVRTERGFQDLAPLLGGVKEGRTAYVFIPVTAPVTAEYRLRFGADWWYQAWLDGEPVSDTLTSGNMFPVASKEGHTATIRIEQGEHVLAIRFISGSATSTLAVGVPEVNKDDIVAWMPRITYTEPPPAARTESVVRILCGAGKPYADQAGNVWSADRGFRGGRAIRGAFVAHGADDPSLYRRGRRGRDFTYAIPIEIGLYAVRLKFAEPEYESLFARPFNVEINGREGLRNYDICQDARGFRKANDRVFRYVVPNAEGRIVLRFSGGFDPGQRTDEAIVQAIEILPESKPTVRIACGSATDFVDWNSFVWSRDPDVSAGRTLRSTRPVTLATPTRYDQALYQTSSCGREVLYALSLPPGLYDVHLKFAELWLTEVGRRPMDIEVNGRLRWQAWDPATAAGQCGMAIDLRTANVTPDKAGRITIRVRAAGDNDAILQGIEVE